MMEVDVSTGIEAGAGGGMMKWSLLLKYLERQHLYVKHSNHPDDKVLTQELEECIGILRHMQDAARAHGAGKT